MRLAMRTTADRRRFLIGHALGPDENLTLSRGKLMILELRSTGPLSERVSFTAYTPRNPGPPPSGFVALANVGLTHGPDPLGSLAAQTGASAPRTRLVARDDRGSTSTKLNDELGRKFALKDVGELRGTRVVEATALLTGC